MLGTLNSHRYIGNIDISFFLGGGGGGGILGISLYRRLLYRGSVPYILL